MVSAANSFGLMDGGVDLAITRFFGVQLMERVQAHILQEYLGEQPIGTSFTIETGHPKHPFVAHTPTMRVPMRDFDHRQCVRGDVGDAPCRTSTQHIVVQENPKSGMPGPRDGNGWCFTQRSCSANGARSSLVFASSERHRLAGRAGAASSDRAGRRFDVSTSGAPAAEATARPRRRPTSMRLTRSFQPRGQRSMPGIASRSPSSSHVNRQLGWRFHRADSSGSDQQIGHPAGENPPRATLLKGTATGDVESHHHDSTKWQHRHSFLWPIWVNESNTTSAVVRRNYPVRCWSAGRDRQAFRTIRVEPRSTAR